MIRVDAGFRQGCREDPYDLDFLALDPGYSERELEMLWWPGGPDTIAGPAPPQGW